MWRDVHSKVTKYYAELFRGFEKDGFNISDQSHLFVLQYLFQNRIQEELNQFIKIWNRHKLSTEGNKSPLQLMALRMNTFPFLDELDDLDLFGVDSDGEEPEENELPAVECPTITCPLSDANFADFKNRISPLSLQTPVSDLVQWFYTALEVVANYNDN